jgi:hypothetical protein
MSPEQTLSRSLRDYPPPLRAESPVQLIQGWYYIFLGVLVALAIKTLQSPVSSGQDLSQLWIVRALGVGLALVGVGLIRASWRKESLSLAIGGPLTLAVLMALSEVIAMANDVLPTIFRIDTGMEFGFLVWWAFALYRGESLVRAAPVIGSK